MELVRLEVLARLFLFTEDDQRLDGVSPDKRRRVVQSARE